MEWGRETHINCPSPRTRKHPARKLSLRLRDLRPPGGPTFRYSAPALEQSTFEVRFIVVIVIVIVVVVIVVVIVVVVESIKHWARALIQIILMGEQIT